MTNSGHRKRGRRLATRSRSSHNTDDSTTHLASKQELQQVRIKAQSTDIRRAIIIIADFMNSAEVSNNLGFLAYDDVIDEFQHIALQVKESVLTETRLGPGVVVEVSTQGDEVCVLLHSPASYDRDFHGSKTHLQLVWSALSFAIYLKLRWLLSDYNQGRLANDLLPRNVSVGIHEGVVVHRKHLARNQSVATSEGFAIAVTKRIESSSRERAASGIVVSDTVSSTCAEETYPVIRFGEARRPDAMKGITTAPIVRDVVEVPFVGPPLVAEGMNALLRDPVLNVGMQRLYDVARRNQSDRWLCSCVAHLLHLRCESPAPVLSEEADAHIIRLVGGRAALVLLRAAATILHQHASLRPGAKETREDLDRVRVLLKDLREQHGVVPWAKELEIAALQRAGDQGTAHDLLSEFSRNASWVG